MGTSNEHYDVLVVGSGLMGAAVAGLLREENPHTRILMLEGGPPIGSQPGHHLHDVVEPEIWERYNERVTSGIQGLYTGARVTADVGATLVDAEPGMYHLSSIGEDSHDMPAASVAWNVGGMGVHWTAATPWPWGEEVPTFIDGGEWDADLDQARRILRVNPQPFRSTSAGETMERVVGQMFGDVSAPGRGIQHMPMAVQRDADGVGRRTGPSTIFPPIATPGSDPGFTLRANCPAIALVQDGELVRGARVRRLDSGDEEEMLADVTVVCADAIRTPQLLHASGVRPPALGCYLNEHAFITGQVLLDESRHAVDVDSLPLPGPGEVFNDSYWLPHSGPPQPFHWQIMNRVYVDDDRRPIAYSVGMTAYTPTQVREENRLAFSDTETDAAGMPRIRIRFGYSESDLALLSQAREVHRRALEGFGDFDPETQSAVLPPGSSLHFTGTVRMGPTDDGTSVCDSDGRVWGFGNLYVAGNGVVPTALACNSTLTGMVTAVRAARAVGGQIARPG
jgi:choline dehydrogenase-like flavoprotein